MSLSSVFGVAASSMGVHSMMMDAVAGNIANANTAKRTSDPAYRPKTVVPSEAGPGGGVHGSIVERGDPDGQLSFEPHSVLADSRGLVRRPDIDLAEQFTTMMVARGGLSANAAVVRRAEDMYRDMVDLLA